MRFCARNRTRGSRSSTRRACPAWGGARLVVPYPVAGPPVDRGHRADRGGTARALRFLLDRRSLSAEPGRRPDVADLRPWRSCSPISKLTGQYESLVLPGAVLLAAPFAMLGAPGLLAMLGMPLDVFAQIGLLMLVGLSAKNAILIVAFAEEARHDGRCPTEPAATAGALHLRPVLITAAASSVAHCPSPSPPPGQSGGSRTNRLKRVVRALAFAANAPAARRTVPDLPEPEIYRPSDRRTLTENQAGHGPASTPSPAHLIRYPPAPRPSPSPPPRSPGLRSGPASRRIAASHGPADAPPRSPDGA